MELAEFGPGGIERLRSYVLDHLGKMYIIMPLTKHTITSIRVHGNKILQTNLE